MIDNIFETLSLDLFFSFYLSPPLTLPTPYITQITLYFREKEKRKKISKPIYPLKGDKIIISSTTLALVSSSDLKLPECDIRAIDIVPYDELYIEKYGLISPKFKA